MLHRVRTKILWHAASAPIHSAIVCSPCSLARFPLRPMTVLLSHLSARRVSRRALRGTWIFSSPEGRRPLTLELQAWPPSQASLSMVLCTPSASSIQLHLPLALVQTPSRAPLVLAEAVVGAILPQRRHWRWVPALARDPVPLRPPRPPHRSSL